MVTKFEQIEREIKKELVCNEVYYLTIHSWERKRQTNLKILTKL